MGRFTFAAARWKLEKGTTIRTAELLMGSRTVGATLIAVLQLRLVNLCAVGLVVLWAASPLGAQSLLRVMSTQGGLIIAANTSSVTYFTTDSRSRLPDESTMHEVSSMINTIYSTLMLAPATPKRDSMDLWGNIKIPFLAASSNGDGVDGVNGNSWDPDDISHQDWRRVPRDSDGVQYSSLLGLPFNLENLATTLDSNFRIESSYMYLDCSKVVKVTRPGNVSLTPPEALQSLPISGSHSDLVNGSWAGCDSSGNNSSCGSLRHENSGGREASTWALALDRFLDDYWVTGNGTSHSRLGVDLTNSPSLLENETNIDMGPTRLRFEAAFPPLSSSGMPSEAAVKFTSTCQVFQRYVESSFRCYRTPNTSFTARQGECRVGTQRPSRQRHASELITPLSWPLVFRQVSSQLPRIMPLFGESMPDPTLQYIHNSSAFWNPSTKDQYIDLADVDAETFSLRLSRVLNTYLLSSQMVSDAMGPGADGNLTQFGRVSQVGADTETSEESVFVVQNWVRLYIVCCLLLVCAGIASTVLTHLAKGPEVMGYASTMLRDSRFIDLPAEARYMDGMDVTRSLGKDRVRLGIIHSEQGKEPLLGVGYEEDAKPMGGFLAKRKVGLDTE